MQPVVSSVVKFISGRGVRRAAENIWIIFLAPLRTLNNIKVTNYFNYKSTLNGVFSRKNLPTIKHGAYVIHLGDKKRRRTHWVSFSIDRKK